MDLSKLYKTRFKVELIDRKNNIWKILCRDFFQKYISKNSSCLEMASGYGEFINNIDAKEKIAIDLNAESKKFLHNNIKFINKDILSLKSNDLHNRVDIVFTSNFLEHLDSKKSLESLLNKLKLLLKKNGKLVIMGPNLRYLPGAYWDYYDHHLGLTHLSLSEVLINLDYDIEVCIDKFLPYTVNSKLPTHPFFVYLYLKIPFLWKIFGKQFFIIATQK